MNGGQRWACSAAMQVITNRQNRCPADKRMPPRCGVDEEAVVQRQRPRIKDVKLGCVRSTE